MADKSFADLLREAGVQPSGAIQYAQSLNRPVPYRSYTPPRPLPRRMRPADVRAYDDNPGVSQQAMSEMHRDRMNGQDAMLREAQGPASNQFADAGMVALETTGVPALRRSYDAFEAGDPRQGIYEGIWGGLGLAGTLGAIPGARRAPRAPMREPVLPQMREAPTPPPGSVLPVRPPQPFRQSLIGGADDLTGASRGVFSEGPPDLRLADDLGWGNYPRRDPGVQIFAGENALTADRGALASARSMEAQGASREDIWRQTGWFRGVDGKWRWEIDDSGARLRTNEEVQALGEGMLGRARELEQGVRARNAALRDQPDFFPATVRRANGEARAEARSLRERANENYGPSWNEYNGRRMEYDFEHPALYQAYPEVGRDVIVARPGVSQIDPGVRGSYNDNRITLRRSGDQTSTTLHETQHHLQDVEGFARGGSGSSAYMSDDLRSAWVAETERILTPPSYEQFAANETFRGVPDAEVRAQYDNMVRDLSAARRDMYNPLSRRAQETAADNIYRRLAGEVEARNTQTRQRMGPSERRARPPWETQDVPDDQQIVRFDGDVQRSEPPAPPPGSVLPVRPPQPREVYDLPQTTVYRNPSERDIFKLLGTRSGSDEYSSARAIIDRDGNVFVFRGWDAIHDDVAITLRRSTGNSLPGYRLETDRINGELPTTEELAPNRGGFFREGEQLFYSQGPDAPAVPAREVLRPLLHRTPAPPDGGPLPASNRPSKTQGVDEALVARAVEHFEQSGANRGTSSNAPTAGPSRPPPDTAKSYRPGPPKGGFFFSRRR